MGNRLVAAARQALVAGMVDAPFFVYDLDALVGSVREFEQLARGSGGRAGQVFFPMFSNPNTELLRALVDANPATGILVNAPEEAEILERRGIGSRDRRIFTGGVVGAEKLDLLSALCAIVHCSSVGDVERLCEIAERPRTMPVGIGLRLDLAGDALKGLTRSELPRAWEKIEAAGLRVTSLHGYPGTEISNVDALLHHAQLLLDLVADYPVDAVNFGGGFGYDYATSSPSVDLCEYFRRFDAIVSSLDRRLPPRVTFSWEPGRILGAGVGVYVTRVIEVRPRAPGSSDTYVDGTFAHIPAPKIRNRQHRVTVLDPQGEPREGHLTWTRLCGATTLSTDTLLPGRLLLPQAEAGDLVLVWDVGCYGRSGSYNFLGRRLPAELGLKGKQVCVLRPAQTTEDVFGPVSAPGDTTSRWLTNVA